MHVSRLFCFALLDNYKRSLRLYNSYPPSLSFTYMCLSLLGAFLFIIILLLKCMATHKTTCGKIIQFGT